MSNSLGLKNKRIGLGGQPINKKYTNKIFLGLHVMPKGRESKDTRIFSWLTAILLMLASLIIFLMIYV